MINFESRPIISTLLIIFVGSLLGLATKVILFPVSVASEAVDVAREQLSPHEMLRKYELFKDMSAQLDKYNADIKIYAGRLKKAEARGSNIRQQDERIDQIESEFAGIKMAYNNLAAEYNSNMSKINYRFTNVGDLPPGATNPLPREYKPYIEE